MHPNFIKSLRACAGKVLVEPSDCWPYGGDNSRLHHTPDAVAFVQNHRQVLDIVRLCNEYDVPIVARGHGTSTTGSAVPQAGGLVLAMAHMNKILTLDAGSRFVVVQAGATNRAVQEYCGAYGDAHTHTHGHHGFFWPPDPGSADISTIGGNIACNAAGPHAVKYGTTRENVLALKAVGGNGIEIVTGAKTSKNSVGLDLTRLLVGSEGTLAIVTEATLKLMPRPAKKYTIQVTYKSIEDAGQAVTAIMTQPAIPSALELIDEVCVGLIDDYLSRKKRDCVMLLLEVDGTEAGANADAEAIRHVCENTGCLSFERANNAEENENLWRARRALSAALRKVSPSRINEDFVVPIAQLAYYIRRVREISGTHQVMVACFGHAGNGNLHINLMFDPDNIKMAQAAHACLTDLLRQTLELNGSISGEHGIGIVKRDFVREQIPRDTLDMMRKIKRLFDPNGILNPGKQLPDV